MAFVDIMRKRYRIFLLGISIAILIAIVWYANPLLLLSILVKADMRFIVLALFVSSLSVCLRVLKWKILLKNIGFFELLPIQMLGITISNFTPGKIGEPLKAILLKMRKGMAVSESLPSIIWERIIDILILIILSLFAVQLISFESKLFLLSFISVGIFIALISLLLVILYNKKIGTRVFVFLKKLPLLNGMSESFMETFYKSKIKKRRLLICASLTAIPWLFEGVVLYLSFLALGINTNPIILSGIIALSILIGVASFLPGGIGSAEFAMIILLGLIGIENAMVVAAVFLYRFLSLWYGVFIGSLSFVYLSKKIDMKNLSKSEG